MDMQQTQQGSMCVVVGEGKGAWMGAVLFADSCLESLRWIMGVYADKHMKRVAWQFVFWRASEGAGSS